MPVLEEFGEGLKAGLALAGRGENHGPCLPVHVHEDGGVMMSPLGRRFIKADTAQAAEVELAHGLEDVMPNHASDALVGDADVPGDGLHRHLSGQEHDGLLQKQREAVAFAGPRDVDPMDAVPRTLDAWNPGFDQTMVLEEVQMPPGEILEVMGFAELFTLGARIEGAAFGLDVEAQFGRLPFGVQFLPHNRPRLRQIKT